MEGPFRKGAALLIREGMAGRHMAAGPVELDAGPLGAKCRLAEPERVMLSGGRKRS